MTSPAGSDGRGRAAGFSLVELLAVAAIMGLLAGVAAVSLRGLRSPALSSAANEVASVLKSTRQMAIASGRNMYLVIPVATNTLTTNLYRTYAIFEEVKPQQEMRTPDASGNYPTNTTTNSWFIPRTDWRTLPEGVVFYSLSTRTQASPSGQETAFGTIGVPEDRAANFNPFLTNITIRLPANRFEELNQAPYLRITPTGRFYTADYTQGLFGAALRLAQGTTRGTEVLVTDTNNYFLIETDAQIGRVRVRTPESYQQP